jgi:histidinol-phosphate aminotransferase
MKAKPLPFKFNSMLETLPVYQPGRPIEEVARELGMDPAKVIKMASNENPMGPSPAAVAAMKKTLRQTNLYPDGNAFYLRQHMAKKLNLSGENLAFGCGSNELLEFLGHALLGPGDDVVVSQYCFAVYPIVTRLFGANLITVPAVDYGHDLVAMAKAITPKTRIVFVANPNNPTGTLASDKDVLAFIKKVPSHVVIAMDEAYIEFRDRPLDLLPLVRSGKHPNLILFRTFSKIYGLAGLRIGYAMGHPGMISVLEKIREPFNTNMLAQVGALAALDDKEHLKKCRANNKAGLAFLMKNFKRLKLKYIPSAGNFIMVHVGNGMQVFQEIQKLGVITRPVGVYQMPEWLRVTVGTPAENKRFITALEKVIGAGA